MQRIVLLSLIWLLMLVGMLGCSRKDPLYVKDSTEDVEAVEYLEIVPDVARINVATTQVFSAYRINTELQTRMDVTTSVTWTSAATQLATITTTGVATGIAAGNVAIQAALDGLTATSGLIVSDRSLADLWVLPPEQVSLVGLNRQFVAIARFADNRLQDVSRDASWSSDNTSVATVAAPGMVSCVGQGTATLTAQFMGQTGSGDLAVLNASPTAFQISPAQSTLPVGASESFTAQLLLDSGDILDLTPQVTWSTSNAQALSVSNVAGSKGLGVGVAAGSAQVIASIQFAGNTLVDTADVTVVAPTLQRVAVTPANISVPVGTRGALHAIAYYSDNSSRDVTADAIWRSDQPDVVSVITSGAQAGNGIARAEGVADVSALFGGQQGSSTVTVTAAILQALQISPLSTSVSAGQQVQFYATGLYSDGIERDLTLDVSWQTDNSATALIDATGLARGVSVGSTTVSAHFDGLQANASLAVTNAVLIRLDVEPLGAVVAAGNLLRYRATGIYSDNTSRDLSTLVFWQSGNEATAWIARGGLVRTVAQGTVQIRASFNGVTGTALLVVTAPTLNQLLVIPDNIRLVAGAVQQYSAVGIYSDHIENMTEQVTWSTSNEQLAEVSNVPGDKGILTALAAGTLTVTASMGAVTDSAPLTVIAPNIIALVVTCADVSINAGYTTQCEAVADYSDGSSVPVTDQSQWQSSVSSVADVENASGDGSAGLVHGISVGNASISATFNGSTGAQTIQVVASVLQTISVTSHNTQIVEGDTEQFTATGHFSDSSTADLTNTAFWQSSDDAVLPISNQLGNKGLATGLVAGTATISAEQDGVTGTSVLITVIEQPASEIRKVEILCLHGEYSGPVNLGVGEYDECKAFASRKDGTVDDVTPLATWSVDKPEILSIIGLTLAQDYLQVRGESRGNTILRAEYDKKAVIQYQVK